MNANEDGEIVIQRITVTRMLTADGGDGYSVECESPISILADLGVLEAAKLMLVEMYRSGGFLADEDEDEEIEDE